MLVDLNTGSDVATLMKDTYPNIFGEAWMADRLRSALSGVLTDGKPTPWWRPSPRSMERAGWRRRRSCWKRWHRIPTDWQEVVFEVNGLAIGTDPNPPYSILWSGVEPGAYTLTAVAEDDEGVLGKPAGRGDRTAGRAGHPPSGDQPELRGPRAA